MNLSTVKTKIVPIALVAAVILIVIVGIVLSLALKGYKPKPSPQPSDIPLSTKKEPVVNGHFDPNAPVSQKSKTAIDKLRPFLPIRNQTTTSTGSQVTYTLFLIPNVNYTVYFDSIGINFNSSYNDPNLAKNVQDFRDVAKLVLDFMKSHGVNPGEIFVSWGFGPAYIQQNAEAWLVPSDKFPAVVKKNGQFVFEKTPVK